MNTQSIISEIKMEVESNNPLFENYFSDAVESANDHAIDSTVEAFDLEDVEFWEDGVSGIEDGELKDKVNAHYFERFEESLRAKVQDIEF